VVTDGKGEVVAGAGVRIVLYGLEGGLGQSIWHGETREDGSAILVREET
jgi:hypothetical protein